MPDSALEVEMEPRTELSDSTPETLAAALDRAALGVHGLTFYDSGGRSSVHIPYSQLRDEARQAAVKLLDRGAIPGDRIAIVAETHVDFSVLFFACQYAGLVPVPLPAIVNLGGRENYTRQLAFLIENSGAVAAFATPDFLDMLFEATATLDALLYVGTLDNMPTPANASLSSLPEVTPEHVSYVQYTSGSTRVARGAVIKQRAIMANLTAIIRHGLQITPADRFFSWLPFYHDMGLVGKLLVPVAAGVPVGFLGTREFAQRPRLWLALMDETQATISFGPPFGYELCAKRLREGDGASYRLHNWRVAGVGAEMIRSQSLEAFTRAIQGSGFDPEAFLPSYGMAEVGVAISFCRLGQGFVADRVVRERCINGGVAEPVTSNTPADTAVREFIVCGHPLPGTTVEVRNGEGVALGDRLIGTIWVQTPSAMTGYLHEAQATGEVLSPGGWVNTGDLGYMLEGQVVVTGREKDLLIVNGRNIWPQDLEAIAEAQDKIRSGDAMAFAVPAETEGGEKVVMLVHCRLRDEDARQQLQRRIESQIRSDLSVECDVRLVEAHSLPRTSSGKPSRSQARSRFLQ